MSFLPSNRRCEMGIKTGSKTIMVKFRVISFSSTEICGFIHGPSSDNSHSFIKERIIHSLNLIQRFSQIFIR